MKEYRELLVRSEYEMQTMLDMVVLILSTIFLILENENSDSYFMVTIILIVLFLFSGIYAHRQTVIDIDNNEDKEVFAVLLLNSLMFYT